MIGFSYIPELKTFRLIHRNLTEENKILMEQNIKAHGINEILVELTDESVNELLRYLK